MTPTLRTLMLAGLGALDLTEEKLRSAFEDLVHRGELHEKEAKDLVAAWKSRAEERREEMARQMRDVVRDELTRQKFARQAELDQLAAHFARLERQVAPVEEVPAR
jgi:polyhydroxyalkanoate synthesis regulator phasin